MKKVLILFTLFILIISLSACRNERSSSGCDFSDDTDKLKVCTTLFPQYEFVRQIGGDHVDVQMLLKPGAEGHSYDPTVKDMMNLNTSDLFIYTNPVMEPWVVNRLINVVENDNLIILNASQNITLIDTQHHEDDDAAVDPDVWTSLKNAAIMIDTILKALIDLKPEHESVFSENATKLKREIDELDNKFTSLFESVDDPMIIHGGHSAIGYFAHDYNLKIVTVFESYSPNEDVKTSNIIELIKIMKEMKQTVLYHEEFINSKSVRLIKNELAKEGIDIELKLIHGIHNVSQEELDNNESYITLMKMNYLNLEYGINKNYNH